MARNNAAPWWISLVAVAVAFPALALTLEAPLPDAALEARAKNLFREIRCMVCQGESIADSPADVASDMRREVRERLVAGTSEDGIKDLLVERYGDSVLMSPPLNGRTWLLWAGPLVLLGCGAMLAASYFKKGRREGTAGS